MGFIILSKKYNVNPDNVATPVAGSLGDVGTLIILASVGTFFYRYSMIFRFYLNFKQTCIFYMNIGDEIYIHIIFIIFFLVLIPLLILYTRKNEFVNTTLKQGWIPIILSMFISR